MASQEVQVAQIAKSDYKKSKIRLEWIIAENLIESLTDVGKHIKSPKFQVNIDGSTYNWVVVLYPNGMKNSSHAGVYIFIVKDASSSAWRDTTLIQYDVSVKSEDGSLVCRNSLEEHPLSKWTTNAKGFPKFCDKDIMEELYVNENLTLVIDATISTEKEDCLRNEGSNPIKYKKEGDDAKLAKNFSQMFNLTSFSDIVIFCGDQKFLCHKLVLATRSTVLKEMLENEQEGKIGNEMEITDASPVIFKDVIDHIYTGRIPDDEKLGGELFKQAVKYKLVDLTKACEVCLFSDLTQENCLDTLITIDTHKKKSTIRKDVIKFIAMNILNVMDNDNWESFAKDHPHMMTEIMRCLASKITEEDLPTIQCKGSA